MQASKEQLRTQELQYGTASEMLYYEPNNTVRNVRTVAAEMFELSQSNQKPVLAVLDGVMIKIDAVLGESTTVISKAVESWWQTKLRNSGGRRSGRWV